MFDLDFYDYMRMLLGKLEQIKHVFNTFRVSNEISEKKLDNIRIPYDYRFDLLCYEYLDSYIKYFNLKFSFITST